MLRFLPLLVLLSACGEDPDPHEHRVCSEGGTSFTCELPCVGLDTGEKDPNCTFELDGETVACTLDTAARIWPAAFETQRGCCLKRDGVEHKLYEWHECD